LSELARLSARDAFVYAVACLEQHATELAQSIDVALVPAEAMSGGNSLRKRFAREIRRMAGESLQPVVSTAEQAAIAEVEREIAREFPFYFDESRLGELHERYGRLRLK
jgi:hypothetical protein